MLNQFKTNPKLIYAAVAIITVLIAYIPARNTLSLVGKYYHLQNKLNSAAATMDLPRKAADPSLLEETDFAKKVFNDVSYACQTNKVVIKQIELPVLTPLPSGAVEQSQQITLTGNFVDIVKSLDDIKEKLKPVKIASLKFTRIDDNKVLSLEANVIVISVKLGEMVD